jgi:hypothetical protein
LASAAVPMAAGAERGSGRLGPGTVARSVVHPR